METYPDTNIHSLTAQIVDEVIKGSTYTPDLDWDVYHRCQELEEQNGLPSGVTAQDIMDYFNSVFHFEDL